MLSRWEISQKWKFNIKNHRNYPLTYLINNTKKYLKEHHDINRTEPNGGTVLIILLKVIIFEKVQDKNE